ncbi:MAG TPA: excinuclease ABC subunit UvrA, partial [Thermoflexales bacterium]|nr:excinuclease ABC subunit UvrA [Thermoflexales bacterium]
MIQDNITVRGARAHNLKNINVDIPRDKLVVITGLSGSGKSSLAFDTIFAEGQRRYVESLSAYARQFLGQMEKPDVDHIEGLSPAISIDQKGSSHNPRSTVGTVTEIYDYLRLMFARIGIQYSPVTGLPLTSQTAQDIVDQIAVLPPGTRTQILAPVIKDKKGHHQNVFEDVRKEGFVRVRVNGQVRDVNEEIELDRYKLHNIEVVVDRLVIPETEDATERAQFLTRLNDSVETALKLGDGFCVAMVQERDDRPQTMDDGQPSSSIVHRPSSGFRDILFSEKKVDPATGISYPDLEPKLFSFNAPAGACPECQGLGSKREFDPALIIPNPDLTIDEGAIVPMTATDEESYLAQLMGNVCRHYAIPTDVPWRDLSDKQRKNLLHGEGQVRIRMTYQNRAGIMHQYETTWEGVIPNLNRRYRDSTSDYVRGKLEEFMSH